MTTMDPGRPDTVLTDGIWDGYLVLPFAGLDRPPRSLAMLGNAAGTVARAYARFSPTTRIDGVEIDPALSRVGRRYFGMRNPRLRVHDEDARPFLRRAEGRRWDVIAVDAYRQPYIPFYLTTREFFRLAASRLTLDGVLIVNVGHPEGDQQLERVLTAGLRAALPNVLRYPKERVNTLLIASRRRLDGRQILPRGARALRGADARALLLDASRRTRAALPGGAAFTDDRAPVEWLIDQSIVRYAGRDGR